MLRWAGLLITAVAIISVCGIGFYEGAQGIEGMSNPLQAGGEARPDVVVIDTMKIFGDLERPEVTFLHDLHTDALEKKNKDCSACHLSGKSFEVIPDTLRSAVENIDRMSPKFKRIRDIGRKEVMDIYHANCIQCHTNMQAEREKTGPVACGECHKESKTPSSRQPIAFDKSLHFRHSKAQEKKCERCHHEYDEKFKKLVYVKEKEGSCRYCHKEKTEENRIALKLASHLACIDCHKKTIAEKKTAGPVKCAGCHDAKLQKLIVKAEAIERMERKQPDVALIRLKAAEEAGPELITRMDPVPFDHKAHETYNDTCRVCHHESLDACNKCHTLEGKNKESKGITLERSMHRAGTDMSCTGCHDKKQQDKNCAGCHVFIGKTRVQEPSTCAACHTKLPETAAVGEQKLLAQSGQPQGVAPTPEELTAAANAMLQARTPVTETFSDEDIPEKVIIKDMVNKYERVELPHRKIVQTLVKNIKDNKLAAYFHREKGTVCQGCHHNSPADKKPPRCANCHSKPFDEGNLFKPGKMGAYHIQCMGCHKEMKLEKPVGCTDCHKERS